MIPNSKEEPDKIINPDEFERRMNLIKLGCENAKKRSAKKKAFLETKQRWRRRAELNDKFGI